MSLSKTARLEMHGELAVLYDEKTYSLYFSDNTMKPRIEEKLFKYRTPNVQCVYLEICPEIQRNARGTKFLKLLIVQENKKTKEKIITSFSNFEVYIEENNFKVYEAAVSKIR